MRLFFAAYLSPESMRGYQALVDRLRSEVPGVLRPVPVQTFHLTLAFLGEIVAEDVVKCQAALDAIADTCAFDISLDKPSILMGRGQPRLIRTDITAGKKPVVEVQHRLGLRLREQLPTLDLRPKPPHVTLARFDKRARRSEARRVEAALGRVPESTLPHGDRLASVHLVQSVLTPSGPSYENLYQLDLIDATSTE